MLISTNYQKYTIIINKLITKSRQQQTRTKLVTDNRLFRVTASANVSMQ